MKVLIIEDEKAAVRNLTAVLKLVAPDMELVCYTSYAWLGIHGYSFG